jgi:hypothetical protein
MFTDSVVLVAGVALVLACGVALAAIVLGTQIPLRRWRMPPVLEGERDLAIALGCPWRAWLIVRLTSIGMALILGAMSGVLILVPILALAAMGGGRFAVAGHAARRRLRMERAFLAQLRLLRERMALAHQSLDSALLEIASDPPHELAAMLAPLRAGGSITANIVQCGQRSRSALIESACAVLLWARTRSLDALIDAIDTVLLPVGEAQLAVEEESLVTLTQQRAVTFAMAALMAIMLVALLRVEAFRAYYATPAGTLVLLIALVLFGVLTILVGRVVKVTRWTRWNLAAMRSQEHLPHA